MYKIDKADENLIAGYTWHTTYSGDTIYMRTWVPGTKNPRQTLLMHHLVIGRPPKGLVTDHIDRDGTNNKRSNLRHVTTGVNRTNSKLNANNKTGYRGVSHARGRFLASISHQSKMFFLGYFDTPQEAHQVYQAAHNRIYGGAHARD